MSNLLNQFLARVYPYKKVLSALFLLSAFLLFLGLKSCYHKHVSKKEIYLIGRDSSWYPIQLYGRERYLVAFMNDLIGEIAIKSEIKVAWLESSPSFLLAGLDDGSFDAVISATRPDSLIQGKYLFSDPLFKTGLVLVVPSSTAINTLKNMEGATISVSASSPPPFTIFKKKGINPLDVNFVHYKDVNKGFELVSRGSIDGIVVEATQAHILLDSLYKGKLRVALPSLTDEGLRLIALDTPIGTRLIEDVNTQLKSVRHDGRYQQLIKKWGLFDLEIP